MGGSTRGRADRKHVLAWPSLAAALPVFSSMVLSDDEVSEVDEDFEDLAEMPQRQKRMRGESKRAASHRAGGKRVAVYEKPVPLQWKQVADGWQEYKLPDLTRVYGRRFFDYSDACKVGAVVAKRPEPPEFFTDKYIFVDATSKVPGTRVVQGPGHTGEMRRRMEVRIVRLSFNYFCHKRFRDMRDQSDAAVASFDHALGVANANLVKVFGDTVEAWSTKQMWAWAAPQYQVVLGR